MTIKLPKYIYYNTKGPIGCLIVMRPGLPSKVYDCQKHGGVHKTLKKAKEYLDMLDGGFKPAPTRVHFAHGAINPWDIVRPVCIMGITYQLPQYVYWNDSKHSFVVTERTVAAGKGPARMEYFSPNNYGGIRQALAEAVYHLKDTYDPSNFGRYSGSRHVAEKHLKALGLQDMDSSEGQHSGLYVIRTQRSLILRVYGPLRTIVSGLVPLDDTGKVPASTAKDSLAKLLSTRKEEAVKLYRDLLAAA